MVLNIKFQSIHSQSGILRGSRVQTPFLCWESRIRHFQESDSALRWMRHFWQRVGLFNSQTKWNRPTWCGTKSIRYFKLIIHLGHVWITSDLEKNSHLSEGRKLERAFFKSSSPLFYWFFGLHLPHRILKIHIGKNYLSIGFFQIWECSDSFPLRC